MFGLGYNPIADFDMDGKVDAFEEALFFNMVMEDEAEMEARRRRAFMDDDDDEEDDDLDLFDDEDDEDDF